jgi:hypothetical protein
MVIVAALVVASLPAAQVPLAVQQVGAERQAIAMVRIVPGAQVKFSELEKIAPESFTDARIRGSDGSSQAARLVEFQ